MPLKKLEFRPGLNREVTSLAGKGGWLDGDKIRFRSGYPEKIGGWTSLTDLSNTFLGAGRTLINWVTLASENLLGIGTHLKYYIERGGVYNDVTPLRDTATISSNAFDTTSGSGIVRVNDTAHGCAEGDYVTITTPTTSLNGSITDSDTTIVGVSTTNFAASGAIWIGSERITYSGKTATDFTGCTRGTGGTTAAAHASGVTVYVDVNGISGSILNDNFAVDVVSANTYDITTTGTATSTATLGYAVLQYEVAIGNEKYSLGTGWGAGPWGGVSGSTGWGDAAETGIGVQLRLWNHANFGEWLLMGIRGGALYIWKPDASPSIYNRATALTAEAGASDVPTVHNHLLVSDVSRFVICFGVNEAGSSDIDPMLIRWSDQESVTNWTPAITNQASFQRLSRGSFIVTAKQTRQEILVWTDTALYSMQYIGPPYVWGFTLLMDNISIMSPQSVVINDNSVIWMGQGNFYIYDGQVNTLPCSVRRYVFDDMNMDQAYQVVSGINGVYDELWWFYCSAGSSDIDRYVIYNDVDQVWYYGTLERTAWLYSPIRQHPMGIKDGQVYYHEVGNDDGETNPPTAIESYVQSSDVDLDDGDRFAYIWRTMPDITFDDSTVDTPQATISLKARRSAGGSYGVIKSGDVISGQNYTSTPVYLVQTFTEYVYTRLRGRQITVRVGSDTVGTHWRLGTMRVDVKQDGGK